MANWTHNIRTEDELKEIVRGVYDCKYFTSLQCENHMVGSIFMASMFMGAPPSKPSFPTPVGNIKKDRKHKLLHFDDLDQWEKDLKQWEDETPEREEYFKNIGMLYEENSKAGPMAINGYPMFMSCHILSMDDTKRFIEMYNKYFKMREDFEKEWK